MWDKPLVNERFVYKASKKAHLYDKPFEREEFPNDMFRSKPQIRCNAALANPSPQRSNQLVNASQVSKKSAHSSENILKNSLLRIRNLLRANHSRPNPVHKVSASEVTLASVSTSQSEAELAHLLKQLFVNCFEYLPRLEKIKLDLLDDNVESYCYSLFQKHCVSGQLDLNGLSSVLDRLNLRLGPQMERQVMLSLVKKPRQVPSPRRNLLAHSFGKQ